MSTTTANQTKPNVALLGPVRLSYLNVFKPRMNDMRKETEYSATLLFPKKPTKQNPDPKKTLDEAARVIQSTFNDKFGDKAFMKENPLKDGDKELDGEGNPKNPGYWYINARCKEEWPPELFDSKRMLVTENMGWTSGDWGKVVLSFYAYEFEGKKGVGAGLRVVQFLYKDDPLGGGGSMAHLIQEEEGDDPSAFATTGEGEYDPFANE